MTKTAAAIVGACALLACATQAHAQYKCTGPGGSISFQQTPCASSAKSERLAIQPPPTPTRQPQAAPPNAPTESADMRIVKTMERDRRVRELTEQISRIENTVAGRSSQMTHEMEQLKNQKAYAKNNLAGATWEQSISTEMAAVAQKYRAMNEADLGRLPALRAELAKVQEQK